MSYTTFWCIGYVAGVLGMLEVMHVAGWNPSLRNMVTFTAVYTTTTGLALSILTIGNELAAAPDSERVGAQLTAILLMIWILWLFIRTLRH